MLIQFGDALIQLTNTHRAAPIHQAGAKHMLCGTPSDLGSDYNSVHLGEHLIFPSTSISLKFRALGSYTGSCPDSYKA